MIMIIRYVVDFVIHLFGPTVCFLQDSVESMRQHLSVFIEFIFALKNKLHIINENSYNNFELRVGMYRHPYCSIHLSPGVQLLVV